MTNTQGPGFILIYPQGEAQPLVSTLNYVAVQTVANAAVVPLGAGGGVTVVAGVSGTDLIIDTNGYYGSPAANATNVFLGLFAGNTTMTGANNTGIGIEALAANTTGIQSTASGMNALVNNTTGSSNIAVGKNAGSNLTTGNDNIDIGNVGVPGEAATIRIGTVATHTKVFLAGVSGVTAAGGVAVLINSAGQLGTIVSSRRFKQDIEDMGYASQALM